MDRPSGSTPNEPKVRGSDLRTAFVAALASVLVGLITYFGTRASVTVQLRDSAHTHARDLANALHASVADLIDSDRRDLGRTQLALASIYFLGDSLEDRKQIIESASSARTQNMRDSIAYLLSIDGSFGAKIGGDSQIVRVLFPTNPRLDRLAWTARAEFPSRADDLDFLIPHFVGMGWIYIGETAAASRPMAGTPLRSSAIDRVPGRGELGRLSRTVTIRDRPFGQRIGVLNSSEALVTLENEAFRSPGGWSNWVQVFLCSADSSIEKPPAAKRLCVQASPSL